MTLSLDFIRRKMGWCPNTHTAKLSVPAKGNIPVPADVPGPDAPRPGHILPANMEVPEGLTTISIVILFATLFFGGHFWWPFFVGAVLVAGMAWWYFHTVKGVI
jgi:hypothetical protein